MSRIERKVRSLVTADAEMKPAIETVLDNATDNEVQWVDVRDEISSGQWGRLIEKGVLVDGDSGIALATGLYSTLLRVALMDTEKMGKYKAQMDAIKEKREAAKERGDDEALEEIQQEQMEAMGDQLGMFKEQFRPMVWIMFLTIPAFLWMYWALGFRGGVEHYAFQNIVIPFAGEVSWTAGIVGPMQIWIVWYFLCSMAFNQIIQKGLNVSMTPSAE